MVLRLTGSRRTAMRLSDAERERAIGALKQSYAEGRLSSGELEHRVEALYRSGTRREAALHLGDLPLRGMRLLVMSRLRGFQRAVLRLHLAGYASANASLVGIWALTGHGAFWPAWLLVPSTIFLGWHLAASHALTRALSRRGW